MLYEDLGLNVAMVCCPVVMPWPWLDSAVGTSSPWKGWIHASHGSRVFISSNRNTHVIKMLGH